MFTRQITTRYFSHLVRTVNSQTCRQQTSGVSVLYCIACIENRQKYQVLHQICVQTQGCNKPSNANLSLSCYTVVKTAQCKGAASVIISLWTWFWTLLQLTFPPLGPSPLLLNLSTLREKHDGLVSSVVNALTPSGPNALSLRSSSVRWASALITPSPSAVCKRASKVYCQQEYIIKERREYWTLQYHKLNVCGESHT